MSKVSIIGCGMVGEAVANALVIGDVCSELMIYDIAKEKLNGVVMDFQHAEDFHGTRVLMANELVDTKDSDIIICTAGVRQKEGESRRDLMARNKKVLENIIPVVCKHSPDAIIIIVANPCDFMTQLAQQLSGFHPSKVFGSGTYLDSSRFRKEISHKLEISADSVHAYVLGEHGDASVASVSHASIGCTPVKDLLSPQDIKWCHKKVISAAGDVIKLRGYTSTAIGMAVGKIVNAIIRDRRIIAPVSVNAFGRCGIKRHIFMSLPCVIDKNGVKPWNTLLPEEENKLLQESAEVMYQASKEILELE